MQTGGRVGRYDRLRLMALAAQTQLSQGFARYVPQDSLRQQRLALVDVDAIEIPSSAAARDAFSTCQRASLFVEPLRTHLSVWRNLGSATGFALHGALFSRSWADSQGWPGIQRVALADAICRHLNPGVPPSKGLEAHLLHAGAGFDLIGLRRKELGRNLQENIHSRWPRLNVGRDIGQRLQAEHDAHPQAHMAWLVEQGFLKWIARWQG